MPSHEDLDTIREKIETEAQALRQELKTELQATRREFKAEMELAIAQVADALAKAVVSLASGEDLRGLAMSIARLRDVVTAGKRRQMQRREADTQLADLKKRITRLERMMERRQA